LHLAFPSKVGFLTYPARENTLLLLRESILQIGGLQLRGASVGQKIVDVELQCETRPSTRPVIGSATFALE